MKPNVSSHREVYMGRSNHLVKMALFCASTTFDGEKGSLELHFLGTTEAKNKWSRRSHRATESCTWDLSATHRYDQVLANHRDGQEAFSRV